ncbi:hypothetical protein E2C01_076926 [Portunus trituberculatus]|uniref:Uncharacterized protein n=1 Tax=Portunus trituberculatus TaxID=210409 RepID=A0A5B7IA16_PORTR|nr:hypothetical protein [Portunus trituberculatus]
MTSYDPVSHAPPFPKSPLLHPIPPVPVPPPHAGCPRASLQALSSRFMPEGPRRPSASPPQGRCYRLRLRGIRRLCLAQ